MFSSFFSLVSNVVEVGKMEKDRAFFVKVLRVCTFSSFFFIFSMSNHLLKTHSHLVGRCERRTPLCLYNASTKKAYAFDVLRLFFNASRHF